MLLREQIRIILLLGSYDPQTKSCLEDVKEEIAKRFSGENVYAILLDYVEIYFADTIQVLAELLDANRVTLFVFQENILSDVYDMNLTGSLDETIYSFLKEKYGVPKINKQPVFNKFDFLIQLAKAVLLIRDKEETRGGEYIELMHVLFQRYSGKVWFFKRNGIRLSAMLMEYLDKFKVNMRSYADCQDLKTAIIRILGYGLSS